MKEVDIRKILNHLLKKDIEFCNDCYTEWEYECNRYKATATDEKGEVKKIRKMTYNEICRETIDDALTQIPDEIRKGSNEEVEEFLLSGWLYSQFKKHNHA